MATSGSTTLDLFSWIQLKFSWTQKSQSVADNTTTIGWQMDLICGNGSLIANNRAYTVTIDGKETTGTCSINIKKNSTQTLATGTSTISHNADGTKIFAYSFSLAIKMTLNNGSYMGTYSGSGSDSLPTIARASQPSLVTYPNTTNDVGDFGETFSIHMNTASQSFTHTVRYEYGDRTGTIATGVVNGTTWAVPLSFMNDIPNATSASGRIYVDTYSGSTLIGTKYTGFTVTVPASVKPSCSVTLDDITGIDNIYGSPVQGLSRIKVTVTPTQAYSSPIASYNISINGAKYPTQTATTGFLVGSGDSPVTVTVTDKRGRTSSAWSYTMKVQAYSPPSITALSVGRCDQDGYDDDQGDYVRVLFSASVSPLGNDNSAQYEIRYKKTTDSSYTFIDMGDYENEFSVTDVEHIFKADGAYSYDVVAVATDAHNSTTRKTSVSTAFTLMDWHNSGTGIRFGGVAEDKNTLRNDLFLRQMANQYCFGTNAGNVMGYVAMVQIEITSVYANAPITFEFSHRTHGTPMRVHVRFYNENNLTPPLHSITYEGENFGVFIVNDGEASGGARGSAWTLYVSKNYANDWITLNRFSTPTFMHDRFKLTFPGTAVASVPNPYWRATPAVLSSIIDCLLPVGMIIQLYSHADPNDMYPGTTWVRLENTFLWGCDESGVIGTTGGEKTHTLTTNEMPKHSHGSVYSQHASGTKDKAWYSTSGTSVAYGAVETGGGAAHNNMPPYIQVSMWRRTA